jgi:hypothetical protein
MINNTKLLKYGTEALTLGLLTGMLMAGCGGGNGTSASNNTLPSASGTVVASYVADQQNGSFTGIWYTGSAFNTTPASATAYTETLANTTTASIYDVTSTFKALINGSWGIGTQNNATSYNLGPSGWVLDTDEPTGNTFIDSGDGLHASFRLANSASYNYTISRTNLAGTTINCSGTCVTTDIYPTGAASYDLTYASNFYILYNLGINYRITGHDGIALTSLPGLGTTTFCDPLLGTVYRAVSSSPPIYRYNVYFVAGGSTCTQSAISTALAGTAQYTVNITAEATGNSAVPYVLLLENWWPIYPNMSTYGFTNPWFYSVQSGYVWEGIMIPTGNVSSQKNKTAINAELTARGYIPIN